MKRISGYSNLSALAFSLILSILIIPNLSASTYDDRELFLTVYGNGDVDVEYSIIANTTLPRITVPLLGDLFTDILIINEENIPLDFEIIDGAAIIDTLGEDELLIIYTVMDLVDKEGGLWTLNIDSPTDFSVILPPGAIIIGLSSIPNTITSVNDQYSLNLNSGLQNVSYSMGVVGTRDQASITIKNAEIAINQAQLEGINVEEALEKIEEAKEAFEQERYLDAEQSALKVLEMVEEASSQTTTEPSPLILESYWIIIIGAIIAIAASTILITVWKLRPLISHKKEVRKIDVSKIFQKRPVLRPEDREAIQFLADSGGEAFESEIREYFKLPKTTIWRMVRRLQREDLIELKKVGGQNLIRLLDTY
jgi:uncharacterized membrane protein